jgi:Flp pilus assembly protein CpaB
MVAPKKSKKVLVQFAIALVVAVVLGIGAVVVGFSLISSISNKAATSQKDALKKAEEAQAELEAIRRRSESQENKPQGLQIVQTQVDISPGTVITSDMLALVQSQDQTQQTALRNVAQAVGKMVKAPMPRGQFLRAADLMDADAWLKVQPDKRAITIRVDGNGTISGSLVPGARVDVLGTIIPTEGSPITRTILQNGLVMRVENFMSSKGGISAITLLVTAKEAEPLSLVAQIGFFHVTLRNNGDPKLLPGHSGINGAMLSKIDDGSVPKVAKTAIASRPRRAKSNSDENIHNASFSPNAALPNPGEGAPGGGRNRFSMKIYRGSGAEIIEFQR